MTYLNTFTAFGTSKCPLEGAISTFDTFASVCEGARCVGVRCGDEGTPRTMKWQTKPSQISALQLQPQPGPCSIFRPQQENPLYTYNFRTSIIHELSNLVHRKDWSSTLLYYASQSSSSYNRLAVPATP